MRLADQDDTYYIVFAAGTTTIKDILGPAWRRMLVRRGGRPPAHVGVVTVACEKAERLGLSGKLSDNHIVLPNDEKLQHTLAANLEAFPYWTKEDWARFVARATETGSGNGGLPAKGRARISLEQVAICKRIGALYTEAIEGEYRTVRFLNVVQTHSGTSRASLVDIPMWVRRVVGDRTHCRCLLIDPLLDDSGELAGLAQARNAASAHAIVRRGMSDRPWLVHHGAKMKKVRGPLYEDVIPMASNFGTDGDARIRGFRRLPDLHAAAARLLEGILERTSAYDTFEDDLNNFSDSMTPTTVDGSVHHRRHHALGEHRIYANQARLEAWLRFVIVEQLRA